MADDEKVPSTEELIGELRSWATNNPGDALPNDWHARMKLLLTRSADRLEQLKSTGGAVSSGPDFNTLKTQSRQQGDPVVSGANRPLSTADGKPSAPSPSPRPVAGGPDPV